MWQSRYVKYNLWFFLEEYQFEYYYSDRQTFEEGWGGLYPLGLRSTLLSPSSPLEENQSNQVS